MTRKWFLMMRNMFLGSEMMFDMIRNYFGVEKNDLIFRPLRGRFDQVRQKVTPTPGGGGMTNILRLPPQRKRLHVLRFFSGLFYKK